MGGSQPSIPARSPRTHGAACGLGGRRPWHWLDQFKSTRVSVTAAPAEPCWQVRYALQYFRLDFMVF